MAQIVNGCDKSSEFVFNFVIALSDSPKYRSNLKNPFTGSWITKPDFSSPNFVLKMESVLSQSSFKFKFESKILTNSVIKFAYSAIDSVLDSLWDFR